jgi:hypothetical protein
LLRHSAKSAAGASAVKTADASLLAHHSGKFVNGPLPKHAQSIGINAAEA